MDLATAAAVGGTIIGAFTLVGGVIGTILQRVIDRRIHTFDFLSSHEISADYIAAREKFHAVSRSGDMAIFANPKSDGTPEQSAIRTILNDMEIISIGIQRGVIDYDLYKRFGASTALLRWETARPFVLALRDRADNPAYFAEFERLARWLASERDRPSISLRDYLF